MKCNKCGELNKDGAKFCAGCGEKLEAKKVFCTECGSELESGSAFCANCGAKVVSKNNNIQNKEENEPWNFDSKIVTITFLICSVLATYLFASPGFMRVIDAIPLISDNTLMGMLAIILGSVLIFLDLRKEKFNKDKEIKRLKELKITRLQVGAVFAIAGIVILLSLGNAYTRESDYIGACFLLFCSFLIMISLIIALNGSKLKLLGEVFTLGISIILFIVSGILYTQGNALNNDTMSRVENFFEHGNANPGTEYINASVYTLIGAIIFLVLFFIIKSYKGRKIANEK